MSARITRSQVLYLLREDAALLDRLFDAELLPRQQESFDATHAETARVVSTLVHDLEVNWSGVEVALRLRAQLLDTQRQVYDLLKLLRSIDE